MELNRITVVPLDDIDEIQLPHGSWSKMLLTGDTVSGIVPRARTIGLPNRGPSGN